MSILMLFWQPAMLFSTCFMLLLVIPMANKMMMMMMLRDRESGSIRSNRGGIDAEKKRTENGTLENTGGNMSRCRRVIVVTV